MLGEIIGHSLDRPLARITRRIPLSPNVLTLAGFAVMTASCFVLAHNLLAGGILILISAVFDILDGVVARVNGKTSRFGAFLDSVLDRYADAGILLALAWYFLNRDETVGVSLAIFSLVGSFLVSYARARAEGLGSSCTYGLMERPERILLICFGAVTGLVVPALWVLTVLTHVTVVQRMHYVWKDLRKEK